MSEPYGMKPGETFLEWCARRGYDPASAAELLPIDPADVPEGCKVIEGDIIVKIEPGDRLYIPGDATGVIDFGD